MVKGVANVWVPVRDMDRAIGFYRDTLGLDLVMDSPQWSELDANGLSLGLNAREPRGAAADGGAVISFRSEDIDADVDELQRKGVQFTGTVTSYDWGRIAPFKDSEGNDLQLYSSPQR